MSTTSSALHDRRGLAANLIDGMATAGLYARNAALRDLATQCLGLTAANRRAFDVESATLSAKADIIAELPDPHGNDIIAAHFDLSAMAGANACVTTAQAQAANANVQTYAGQVRSPLLIFTLPYGVQFIHGEPERDNPSRLTHINRLTYHWGESNRTTLDALDTIGRGIDSARLSYAKAERPPIQMALINGFNAQPVTDAFFRHYKAAYDTAVAEFAGQMQTDDAVAYAQTLFNRLLFVHFVSRKGWLTFKGRRDYLNALWADYLHKPTGTNFYADRLDALFHDGINTPPEQRPQDIERIIGQVPFLNGGLFERNALDQQATAISDDIIEKLLSPNGLFNRYNFTVMEATPLDTEVAVDPEMLGKLFEETVNERHRHGAYYTPRPVVAFMCREAIKGYLAGRNINGLSNDKISDLVDNRNPEVITVQQATDIASALTELKAIDPACGSGAFLLGMMHEILAINDSLRRPGHEPATLYRQKLDVIANNLYGTDIDALAISTAMLRLWLSLAVEHDDAHPPEPLPNLDLKLKVGDSLAGPDPRMMDWTQGSIVNGTLEKDIAAYTTAHDARKRELKTRVNEIDAHLRNRTRNAAPSPAVDWRIDFATVMYSGGFDIVITNPPYVRQEEITPTRYKQSLLKAYPDAAVGRSDLYCYFYARGLQLLKPNGMHVFVCSNSWLDVGYGAKLQQYLLDNAALDAIYECAVERQFSTAAINTIISVARKGRPSDSHPTRFVRLLEEFDAALADHGLKRVVAKTAAELRAAGTDPKPSGKNCKARRGSYVGDKWGCKYLRAPDIYHQILNKYGDKLVPLEQIASVRRGVTTGHNRFFILHRSDPAAHRIDPQFLIPIMTTPRESLQMEVNASRLPYRLFHCPLEQNLIADAGTRNYIAYGQEQGLHRQKTARNRRLWYDVGRITPTRLLLNKMIDATSRAFLATPAVAANNVFYCIDAPESATEKIGASLNSTLGQLMINTLGRTNFGGGMLELAAQDARRLPVIRPELIPSLFKNPEVGISQTATHQRQVVDDIINEALGVTPSEKQAVIDAVAHLVATRKHRASSNGVMTNRTLFRV